jgi:outer membrane scaffolding protein for murein synthesis (MipA/OmpV family)
MYKGLITKLTAGILLSGLATTAMASGITRDIREGASAEETREDGGYFEIGLGHYSKNAITFKGNEDDKKQGFGLRINTGYQWKGLFIDLNDDDGFVFGYNALNTNHWSYDIVAGALPEITDDQSDLFASLRERKAARSLGLRATGFYGKNIFQFEIRDARNDEFNGVQASALAGTSWQIRNWNTHVIAGLHYSSSSINDYYWGVRADEVSADFSEYKADASATFSTEFGVTYPISESWVFRGKVNYVYGSDEFANSPLRADDTKHFVGTSASVSYVF